LRAPVPRPSLRRLDSVTTKEIPKRELRVALSERKITTAHLVPSYNKRNPKKGIERLLVAHGLAGRAYSTVTTKEIPKRELRATYEITLHAQPNHP
jgi:hypothetical protein